MEDPSRSITSGSNTGIRFPVSLRTRLIAANILITVVSIAALGYYVSYRSQQSTTFLTSELDSSERQKAVDSLTSAGASESRTLDDVFSAVHRDITTVGLTSNQLLSLQGKLGSNSYWDAMTSLARLPNGSWDNTVHTEPASVFIPAKVQLNEDLAAELNTLKQLDFSVPNILASNGDIVAVYFGGPSGETLYYPNIDLANIVPPDFDVTQRPWYLAASPTQDPGRAAVWSTPYLDAARNGLVITASYPIFDDAHGFRGVVAMDVQLNRMAYLVSAIRAGRTGYGFVVDSEGRLIAMPEAGYKDLGYTAAALPLGQLLDQDTLPQPLPKGLAAIIGRMKAGQSGLETISFNGQDRYVVFRPIPSVRYSLAIIVPTAEMLAGSVQAKQQIAMSATNTQQITFVLVAMILGFALLATLAIGNSLISPLVALTGTAEEITRGNLEARAGVRGRDEIATLAQALNTMTSRIRDLVRTLEQRVRDRTAALEVASISAGRRAAQFEAITQVTRAISSVRNMDELLPVVAAVISQYFDFYHVGIFLNDEDGEFAWLVAANSEGGHRMLQRRHRLKIGEQGIVGYVAGHGETRVARSVGEDAVFFNNPDLPETKSEAALPLRRAAQIAGVIDVQSVKEDAFSDEDLGILAILADQVGLAMENTRLFETTQRALTEAETLYRQYVHEAWNRLPQEGQVTEYRYTPRGAAQTTGVLPQAASGTGAGEAPEESQPLILPIKLRGEVIGNLIVRAPRPAGWSPDEFELAQAVAERVAFSAENARLFDETSRRAERERLVTEITSRIRSSNDPDEMIQTAVDELRNALGATEIQVIPQVVPAPAAPHGLSPRVASQEVQPSKKRGNGAEQ